MIGAIELAKKGRFWHWSRIYIVDVKGGGFDGQIDIRMNLAERLRGYSCYCSLDRFIGYSLRTTASIIPSNELDGFKSIVKTAFNKT